MAKNKKWLMTKEPPYILIYCKAHISVDKCFTNL